MNENFDEDDDSRHSTDREGGETADSGTEMKPLERQLADQRRSLLNYLSPRAPEASVEDLVSDIMAEALAKLKFFDPSKGTLEAWVHGFARMKLVSSQRDEARRDEGLQRLSSESAVAAHSADDGDPARAGTESYVSLALKVLTDSQRYVLMAHVVQGIPCEVIADELEIPASTVRSRLHRARALMRCEIERLEGTAEE